MTKLESRVSRASMAALLAWAVLACGGEASGPTPPGDLERRNAFREALRHELGSAYETKLPPLEQQDYDRGAAMYSRLCESCHGLAGRGNGLSARMLATKPPDLADPRQAAFFSDRAKLRIVERGVPGSPMIGWSQVLNEEECEVVLQYLLDLASSEAASSGTEGR